jgi:diguanylate cyclase (GGDEF)-like protein/PAS domain S-box-containing protein
MEEASQPGAGTGSALADALLRLEESLLRPTDLLERLPDAVVAMTRGGRIAYLNSLAEELFGYPREELIGEDVSILWPERVREHYATNAERYFDTEHPLRFSTEVWGLRRDGSEFAGEMSWGVVETTSGPLLLAIGRDVSERRAAEARVRAVAALGELALSRTDPVSLADDAVELLMSTLPIGGAAVQLVDGISLANRGAVALGAVRLPIGTGDRLLVSPERELDDEEMSHLRAVANTLAVALARLRDEERVRHDAVHDPLTGLANRILLSDNLAKALSRSDREGTATGLLYVDLDNFKQVNDVSGHATGDAVLAEVGGRLRTVVRPTDTVARVGGDEFVVLCEDIDEDSAMALGRRLLDAVSAPVQGGPVRHELSASIGIALGRSDAEALLRHADEAAYRAKANGRGRVELFR